MRRIVFLTLLIFMIPIQVLFAQKVLGGEKLIEKFLNELSVTQSIPDSFIQRYIVSDGSECSINKIKERLALVKTAFLHKNAEKSTVSKIEELSINTAEFDTRYYSIRLDNEHSLNFVVLKDKIKSISSYTASSYNTTIFF